MKEYQVIGWTFYGEADTIEEARAIAADCPEKDDETGITFFPGIYGRKDVERIITMGQEVNRIAKPGAENLNAETNRQHLLEQEEHMSPYQILDMLHRELVIRHRDRIMEAYQQAKWEGAKVIAIDRDASVKIIKDTDEALGYIFVQVSPGVTPEQALRAAADKLRDEIMTAMYEEKFENGYIGTI